MQAASAALVRGARPEELGAVCALLARCGLLADELAASHVADVVVADEDGRIVGTAALQRCGNDGLLRSVAVPAPRRGVGTGSAQRSSRRSYNARDRRACVRCGC